MWASVEILNICSAIQRTVVTSAVPISYSCLTPCLMSAISSTNRLLMTAVRKLYDQKSDSINIWNTRLIDIDVKILVLVKRKLIFFNVSKCMLNYIFNTFAKICVCNGYKTTRHLSNSAPAEKANSAIV